MSHIEQILSRCDLHTNDEESLRKIRMHSEGAFAGIMAGLGMIGNVVFWACDNDNYSNEMARDDLQNLGEMLMHLPGIAAALNFNAGEADTILRERKQQKPQR